MRRASLKGTTGNQSMNLTCQPKSSSEATKRTFQQNMGPQTDISLKTVKANPIVCFAKEKSSCKQSKNMSQLEQSLISTKTTKDIGNSILTDQTSPLRNGQSKKALPSFFSGLHCQGALTRTGSQKGKQFEHSMMVRDAQKIWRHQLHLISFRVYQKMGWDASENFRNFVLSSTFPARFVISLNFTSHAIKNLLERSKLLPAPWRF